MELSDEAQASSHGPSETVEVEGRTLPLPEWEAEILLRAAGWIFLYRGAGLVLGATAGLVALSGSDRSSVLTLCAVGVGLAAYAVGLGAHARRRWTPVLAVIVTALWTAAVLAPWIPGFLGEYEWSSLLGLSGSKLPRLLLNLFVLSDIFATYAIVRPSGYRALGAAKPALAPLRGSSAWRRTGRAMVASAMLLLAFLSMAAMLVLGPGLILA